MTQTTLESPAYRELYSAANGLTPKSAYASPRGRIEYIRKMLDMASAVTKEMPYFRGDFCTRADLVDIAIISAINHLDQLIKDIP